MYVRNFTFTCASLYILLEIREQKCTTSTCFCLLLSIDLVLPTMGIMLFLYTLALKGSSDGASSEARHTLLGCDS